MLPRDEKLSEGKGGERMAKINGAHPLTQGVHEMLFNAKSTLRHGLLTVVSALPAGCPALPRLLSPPDPHRA